MPRSDHADHLPRRRSRAGRARPAIPGTRRLAVLLLATLAAWPGPSLAASSGCDPATLTVALDVGHSLASPGATSARGAPEFEYNRRLALLVAAAVAKAGFPVLPIGAAGTPIRLEERTRLARAGGAGLFLSLHHDSVQPHYLLDWTVDGHTRRYSDRFRGFSLFVSGATAQAAPSRAFAGLLGEALLAAGLTPTLHHAEPIPGEGRPLLDARIGLHRYDQLAVLRTAAMPAVLLEAGVIVHRDEEEQVRSGQIGARVAEAVAASVRRFCERQVRSARPG